MGEQGGIPALATEGQSIHPQTGQDPHASQGELLGAPPRPREGKLRHQIGPARQSHGGAKVGIGHGDLAPLYEASAHDANHATAIPYLLPHTGQQIGMAAVKGIEFTDHTRGPHKPPSLSKILYPVYHGKPSLSRLTGDFHKDGGGFRKYFEKQITTKF